MKQQLRYFAYVTFLIIVIAGLGGCKPEKKADFTLQLKLKYGAEDFSLSHEYTDNSNRRLAIERLRFYLSHITLIKTDNAELEIKDVALMTEADPNSLILNFNDLKGDFKAIRFGVGLDSLQNASDPLSFADSHPLSNSNGMYWSWLKYIFANMEGKCDTVPGSTALLNRGLIYHIGGNHLYRTRQLSKNFSVCCDNNYVLQMNLDVKKVFYGTTQNIDIATEGTSQTSDFPDVALKFADNFADAFYLP